MEQFAAGLAAADTGLERCEVLRTVLLHASGVLHGSRLDDDVAIVGESDERASRACPFAS
jgi:hypothetical protein